MYCLRRWRRRRRGRRRRGRGVDQTTEDCVVIEMNMFKYQITPLVNGLQSSKGPVAEEDDESLMEKRNRPITGEDDESLVEGETDLLLWKMRNWWRGKKDLLLEKMTSHR